MAVAGSEKGQGGSGEGQVKMGQKRETEREKENALIRAEEELAKQKHRIKGAESS